MWSHGPHKALSNSMKLWAMLCRATHGRQVLVESSDKTWSTREGNGRPLQYPYLENPMNSMKRHKDMLQFMWSQSQTRLNDWTDCLFNFYADYIIRNAGLDEAQAGVKITGRNINILRYVGDTTLMAESEEELKSLLMKVKEESEKVSLKLNIQKLRSWHPIPSLQGK